MKIRTNLSAHDLDQIGKGLRVLAKKDSKEYQPENPAEKALLAEVESVFDQALKSLQSELESLGK